MSGPGLMSAHNMQLYLNMGNILMFHLFPIILKFCNIASLDDL